MFTGLTYAKCRLDLSTINVAANSGTKKAFKEVSKLTHLYWLLVVLLVG